MSICKRQRVDQPVLFGRLNGPLLRLVFRFTGHHLHEARMRLVCRHWRTCSKDDPSEEHGVHEVNMIILDADCQSLLSRLTKRNLVAGARELQLSFLGKVAGRVVLETSIRNALVRNEANGVQPGRARYLARWQGELELHERVVRQNRRVGAALAVVTRKKRQEERFAAYEARASLCQIL